MEKLIKGRIKLQLRKVNMLQAGSRENRSPCDSLFLLHGVVDHAKYLNKQIFYDYDSPSMTTLLVLTVYGLKTV